MEKINKLFLIVILAILPQLANAHDFVADGIYYLINGNEATVTFRGNSYSSYNEYTGTVSIPANVTYNGTTYSVTAIGENAFRNCSSLTSLTIPNSVTKIWKYAVCGCSGLKQLSIGNSVTHIYGAAFRNCSGLALLNIPNSVTWVGGNAFTDCTGLTNVTIGESVAEMGEDSPFNGCTNIKTVNWNAKSCADFASAETSPFYGLTGITTFTFGSSVENIPAYLCQNKTRITSLTIPASVTSIGTSAFNGCTGLTSVTWNAKSCSDFTSASTSPFYGLTGITTFTFGSIVEKIPAYLCQGKTGITSLTIPASVTSIGTSAFNGCTGLTSVTWNAKSCADFSSSPFSSSSSKITTFTFGSSVETVPAYLCYGMNKITSITIPNSVTSIKGNVFQNCTGLTSINIGNSVISIGGNSFNGCTGLTSVNIPNSVTNINGSAFKGCTNLSTLYLGSSLTSIANYAFQNTNLKKVSVEAMTPPTVSTASFSGLTLSNIQLCVPFDAHYSYYNHSVWKNFYYVHLFSGTTVGTGGFSGSGSGTESDPYLIFNPIQLYSVRNFTGYDGVVFKLMSDIDLTEFLQDNNPTQGWEPIGVQDSPFKGVFHGENHTISGLFSNRQSTDYNGLFGFVESATIENLTLQSTTMKGGNYSGSLCGFAQYSTLSNIITTVNVNGKSQCGGFVGMAYNGTVNNCHHTGAVTSTGDEVGGFAGALTGTITECSHEGNVSGQNYTGGFVGHNSAGLTTITCNASTVTGADYTGGFAGNNSGVSSSLISNSLTVTGGERTGGFVGQNTATLSNVTNSGKTVTGSNYVGGFVGDNNGNISDATSTLTNTIGTLHHIAGFAGYSNATFTNITSTLSTVESNSNGYYNGGFVGYANNATMTNCKSRAVLTSGNRIGGFVGFVVDGITATNCYAIGEVTSNTTSSNPSVGGFIGYGTGNVNLTKCGAVGDVSAKAYNNNSYVSGFIGYLHNDNITKTITNCFAVGDVTATGKYVGGLVGMSWQANIDNSYYSGKLTGAVEVGGIIGGGDSNIITKNYANGSISGTQYVGGIAGRITTSTSITSCVAAQDAINATNGNIGRIYGSKDETSSVGTSGTNEANRGMTTMTVVSQGQQLTVEDGEQHGTSVGKVLLKYKSTYQGINWNFSTDWTIQETESYPYKLSQCAPPVFTGNIVSGATSVSGKCANGASVFVVYNGETYQASVNGTTWTVTVPAMQSGATIKAYAVTDELIQSYFVTATVGFEGNGTEENPYLIYTADDLAGINSYSYYKVMNDIDLSTWINTNSPSAGWVPVGKTGGGTMCQLDGDGHTISGLWTNSTGANTGLISSVENATIKNLTVNVANGKMVKGSGDYVGIVVGKSIGTTFNNVTVIGNVSGGNYVASVAGYADGGTFINCNANGGQITASGTNMAGITGYATDATFTECKVKDITATSAGNFMAGIAAYTTNVTFANCKVDNMTASTSNGGHVGGIAGYSDNDQFTNCEVANSSFIGTGSYAGGIAGGSKSNCKFDSCYVKSTTIGGASYVGGLTGQVAQALSNFRIVGVTINATGSYVGGIVGKTTRAITNCYADVTLTGKDYIGGITGHTSADIETCYTLGDINTTDLTNCRAGGIVGYTTGNITNCYSTANTRGGQYAGGIAGYSFGAISKCYSSGDLYATNFGAGIVGYIDGSGASVNNCFAINNKIDVSDQNGVAMRVIGGFKNGAATPQANNYALKSMVVSVNDVTQQIYDDLLHGIGVTQNVLETQATYTAQGWNFSSIWGIDEGNGYPYLMAFCEPVLVTGISLNKTSTTLREGSSETLVATVTPADADNQTLDWTSSDNTIAAVDNNGNVSALSAGTAIITATTTDGSNLSATCEVTVLPLQTFTPGDVNDDGTINVGDYVDVASYILEMDPQPFNFAAADLDENNEINVGDLVGVAYMALNYEGKAQGAMHNAQCIIQNEGCSMGAVVQSNEVIINLSNNMDITAMQMDLTLPQGMTLIDASLTDRATASHQIEFSGLGNGDYRLLAASSALKSFKNNEGAVLTLSLAGSPSGSGSLSGIILASPNSDTFMVDDITLNFNPTGLFDVYTDARIYREGDNIVILSPADGVAQIVMPNGMFKNVQVIAGRNVYPAPSTGLIIVKMGNEVKKMRF